MDSSKKNVVVSFLGTVLDNSGQGNGRWRKWRPNVAMHQYPDFQFDRVELLIQTKFLALAERIKADIQQVSPHTEVNFIPLEMENPWDFSEVYTKLHEWAHHYPFDIEKENYITHITTGTHVAQICLFLLVESRQIPSVLLQTAPPKNQQKNMVNGDVGSLEFIDLDLARYDVLAERLAAVRNDAVLYLKSGIPTKNQNPNLARSHRHRPVWRVPNPRRAHPCEPHRRQARHRYRQKLARSANPPPQRQLRRPRRQRSGQRKHRPQSATIPRLRQRTHAQRQQHAQQQPRAHQRRQLFRPNRPTPLRQKQPSLIRLGAKHANTFSGCLNVCKLRQPEIHFPPHKPP